MQYENLAQELVDRCLTKGGIGEIIGVGETHLPLLEHPEPCTMGRGLLNGLHLSIPDLDTELPPLLEPGPGQARPGWAGPGIHSWPIVVPVS